MAGPENQGRGRQISAETVSCEITTIYHCGPATLVAGNYATAGASIRVMRFPRNWRKFSPRVVRDDGQAGERRDCRDQLSLHRGEYLARHIMRLGQGRGGDTLTEIYR